MNFARLLQPCVPGAAVVFIGIAAALRLPAQTPSDGALRGTVHHVGTKAFLEGVVVQVEGTALSAVTARDGRFRFDHVPAGEHRVTTFYTGLRAGDTRATVAAGRETEVAIALSDDVTLLDQMVVTGMREGNAASLTKQRNAINLVHVVSMDAFGNVNDGNIGYFLQKLPGVAVKKEAGEIVGVGLRGTPPELNSVMLDGVRTSAAIAGFTPQGDRAPLIDQIPSELIKEIVVFKGITPDLPADSLSGGINLQTKSAFDYRERFVSFRLGLAQNTSRETLRHKYGPNAAITFLDAYGPGRRLGVALTSSYSKTYSYRDRIQGSFSEADGRNSLVRMLDDTHARVRAGAGTKLEYRFDSTTRVWFDANVNYFSADSKRLDHQAGTGNRQVADYNVVSRAAILAGATPRTTSGAAAGIAPGYTDTFTEMLAATPENNSNLERKRSRQYKLALSLEKTWTDARLTASASFNPSTYDNLLWGADTGATGPIGMSIDLSRDLSRPIITQTFGPSIAFGQVNYANWIAERFSTADYTHEKVISFRGDYERTLRLGDQAVTLKSGVNYRHQFRWNRRYTPSWTLVGADGVAGPNPATGVSDDDVGRFKLPVPSYGLFNNHYPGWDWLDVYAMERHFADNPRLYSANGTSVSYYPPKNIINEYVPAGYVQARSDFGRLNVLSGVRYEATKVKAQGRLNDSANPSILATKTEGDYAKVFPSVHLRYQARQDLVAHASYSTGSARPRISDLLPTTSVNYTGGTTGRGLVTQANPSLKPQYSRNLDASVEYYLEPAGVLSAGWFHKEITDFITNLTPNPIIGAGAGNGFDGRYAGFELATRTNLNSATIDGWEFNYVQRFVKLPRPFNGLGAFANYTHLRTKGSTSVPPPPGTVPNTQLVDFVPNTHNLGLTYDSHGFGARIEYHYKGRLKTGNNPNPIFVQYMSPDVTWDVNLSYRFTPKLTVFVDVVNVFNESPYVYIGNTNRRQINEVYGTRVVAGVSGRF